MTQLSNVVGRSNPAPVPAPSNTCSSRSENAVEELHRRKDVVVIEFEHDRVPSKTEKIELEKSKRAISGFDINRE